MKRLRALWNGELPLGEAFWTWTILFGLLVNISTSLFFLILITLDQPLLALIVGYGFSIPYNVMAVVGVWRSAARYDGPRAHAEYARWASLILMTVLSLT